MGIAVGMVSMGSGLGSSWLFNLWRDVALYGMIHEIVKSYVYDWGLYLRFGWMVLPF